MGFGIATLGYGFLLTYEAGGGIIAGILLAYGFFLASAVNKRFLYASISALFMIPHSILLLLGVIGIFELNNFPTFHEISFTIFLLAWLTMSYYYLTAVKEIAVENKNLKLSNKAANRLYLTAIMIFAALSTMFFELKGFSQITFYIFVFVYAMIIFNTLFLHNCFLMITTERQYKKDKIMMAEEDKKVLERRNKKK